MVAVMFCILTGLSFFWRCDCCCINENSGNYQNKGFSKESKVCMNFYSVNSMKLIYAILFGEEVVRRKL
jgi:hypothetical protein